MSTSPNEAAPVFKSKKKLTLPTFKFEVDKTLYLLILGEMHVGKKRGKPRLRVDGTEEEPPTLTHVVNMSTGEHGQIMVAEIIKTELTETYPNHTYVGRAFGITKQKRKEGKRYDPYAIEEFEVPANFADVAADAVKEVKAKVEAEKPTSDAVPNTAAESPPPATPTAATRARR